MDWITVVSGAWLILWSFVMNVTGGNKFMGGLVFKFIPFCLGAATVVVGLKNLGIL